MKLPCVYILASKKNGTLYTGITSDLVRRVYEHKSGDIQGFTQKYDVKNLVWYQVHENFESAISQEKKIKKWPRQWKIQMIEASNPDWTDLYSSIL